jgi:serine protease Do
MKFKKTKILIMISAILMNVLLLSALPVNNEGKSPFVKVVKDTRESVVNIRVDYEVKTGGMGQMPFNDDFFKFFFPDQDKNRQPKSRESVSMGSGFIFKREGKDVFIITNNHVVENGKDGEITVTLADRAKYTGEIVGLDQDSDIAVIKIEVDFGEKIVIAPLGNSEEIEIGDWAIAIGNPFGQLGLERTVTVGVISAVGRSNLNFGNDSPIFQNYIQTDAAINPGNSGGPLVNIKGEVIGVNAAITSTSGGNVGIGFAIPANLTKKVVTDLITDGKVKRAYLGIYLQDITSDLSKSFELDEVAGVLVTNVVEDTPAEKAGLRNGDVILEFGNKKVDNVSKFMILVAGSEIGVQMPVKIVRNKKTKELVVKLSERPSGNDEEAKEEIEESSDWLGLEVESLKSDFATRNKIEADSGVVLSKINPKTASSKSDLRVGDVIIEINSNPVENIKGFKKIINNIQKDAGEIILFYVKSTSGGFRFVPVNTE